MERVVVLPPIRDRVRSALLNLPEFKDIPTEKLQEMARHQPGGIRLQFGDRAMIIAILLGTRHIEVP